MSAYDSARTSIAITGLFGALALAPVMPFIWVWPESGWILGSAHRDRPYSAASAISCSILAHGRAPAPVLAPFIYVELVFMMLLGWLVFSDVPDEGWTLAGAAVVIGAGLYLLLREDARVGRYRRNSLRKCLDRSRLRTRPGNGPGANR